MKKFILILLLLTSSLFSESFFQEADKQKHMQGTAVVSLIASNMAVDVGYTVNQSFWIGVVSALAVGLGKELLDSQSDGNSFSGEDMVANGIGGVAGALPVFVIYEF